MLGDVLLITQKHKNAARDILKRVLRCKTNKYIVAISGESGSGKSELAHCLAVMLKEEKIHAKLMHTDNYYKIEPTKRTEWRKKHGINNIGFNEYDWELINKNIQDFKMSRQTTMPCIDIIPERVDYITTDFKGIDLLVIDGLYAINANDVDLRIFIDLTYHDTKGAQIERMKEPSDEFRLHVLEREHIVVQSLKPTADLLVNKYYEVVDAKDKIVEDYELRDKKLQRVVREFKSKLNETQAKEFENTQRAWLDFRETNARMFAEFANLKDKAKSSYYYFLDLITQERINNLQRTVIQ